MHNYFDLYGIINLNIYIIGLSADQLRKVNEYAVNLSLGINDVPKDDRYVFRLSLTYPLIQLQCYYL